MVHDLTTIQPTSQSRRPPRVICWQFPSPPFVKVNVNGSARGNLRMVAAGVVPAAKVLALALTTNVAAELHALKEGILLALSLGCSHLFMETNSLQAVRWLHNTHSWPWRHFHLLT